MPASRVAVVIVNYNAGDYLDDCLKAMLAQTRQPDRVIVVDNNSSDDSINLLESYPDWFCLLPLAWNTGFAVANNIAISYLLEYDYVALLNPDTVAETEWLEHLLAATTRHGSADCYGSRMLSFDGENLDGTGDDYHVCGLYWRRDNGTPVSKGAMAESEIFSACAAAALYPRKGLTDIAGFDEDYFCYSEDIDLGFRLRSRGSRIWYVPDAVVRHAGSGTTGRHSEFSVYHGHRNLVWTFVQNMPGRYFWIHLPEHLLMNLVTVLHFSLRGHARTILRAKWHALLGLGRALSKRKLNRYMSRVSPEALIAPMRRGFLTPYLRRHE